MIAGPGAALATPQLPARWVVAAPPDPGVVAALASATNLPRPLAALLVQRGFTTVDAARNFLRPSLDQLTDPLRLKDMDRAVDAIVAAVRENHVIAVNGDYDVDGQCSTAILVRTLRVAGAKVAPFIPHRLRDGYDFGPAGLAAAEAAGARLIITCDSGINAHETVRLAEERGIRCRDHRPSPSGRHGFRLPRRWSIRSGADDTSGLGHALRRRHRLDDGARDVAAPGPAGALPAAPARPRGPRHRRRRGAAGGPEPDHRAPWPPPDGRYAVGRASRAAAYDQAAREGTEGGPDGLHRGPAPQRRGPRGGADGGTSAPAHRRPAGSGSDRRAARGAQHRAPGTGPADARGGADAGGRAGRHAGVRPRPGRRRVAPRRGGHRGVARGRAVRAAHVPGGVRRRDRPGERPEHLALRPARGSRAVRRPARAVRRPSHGGGTHDQARPSRGVPGTVQRPRRRQAFAGGAGAGAAGGHRAAPVRRERRSRAARPPPGAHRRGQPRPGLRGARGPLRAEAPGRQRPPQGHPRGRHGAPVRASASAGPTGCRGWGRRPVDVAFRLESDDWNGSPSLQAKLVSVTPSETRP